MRRFQHLDATIAATRSTIVLTPMLGARTTLAILVLLTTGCSPSGGGSVDQYWPRIHNDLTGIACPSVSLCFAVGNTYVDSTSGYSDYRSLIERWNGSSWSIVDSPNPTPGDTHLAKVSCASSSLCFAVGYEGPYVPHGHPLIIKWNGSLWSAVPTPNVNEASNALLRDVQCVTPSVCFAVGQYVPSQGNGSGLIERWNGSSWTAVAGPHEGLLVGVGCATASFCFASGIDYTFDGAHSVSLHLTELWDGSSWRLVPSGSHDGEYEVDSISCSSRIQCAGSGSLNNQFASLSMMEAWDGVSWRAVATPHPAAPSDGRAFDRLVSVSCADASFCQAIGSHVLTPPHSAHSDTLAERWDGSSWTILRTPNGSPTPGANDALLAVSCPTRSRCLAMGHYDGPNGFLRTLAEQWNGNSWSIVPSANRSA